MCVCVCVYIHTFARACALAKLSYRCDTNFITVIASRAPTSHTPPRMKKKKNGIYIYGWLFVGVQV